MLDAAAGAASHAGILVLRAAGVEFEADLAFSGLQQVLLPLLDAFGKLNDAHRDALNVALGYGKGPPPDRLPRRLPGCVTAGTGQLLRTCRASAA